MRLPCIGCGSFSAARKPEKPAKNSAIVNGLTRAKSPDVRNLLVVAVSFFALFNVACSGNDRPAQSDDDSTIDQTDDDAGTGTSSSSLSNTCDTENVGCPCANEGAVFSCGHVKRKVGDYVSCVEEFSTCEKGVWSKCGGNTQ